MRVIETFKSQSEEERRRTVTNALIGLEQQKRKDAGVKTRELEIG